MSEEWKETEETHALSEADNCHLQCISSFCFVNIKTQLLPSWENNLFYREIEVVIAQEYGLKLLKISTSKEQLIL